MESLLYQIQRQQLDFPQTQREINIRIIFELIKQDRH